MYLWACKFWARRCLRVRIVLLDGKIAHFIVDVTGNVQFPTPFAPSAFTLSQSTNEV